MKWPHGNEMISDRGDAIPDAEPDESIQHILGRDCQPTAWFPTQERGKGVGKRRADYRSIEEARCVWFGVNMTERKLGEAKKKNPENQ